MLQWFIIIPYFLPLKSITDNIWKSIHRAIIIIIKSLVNVIINYQMYRRILGYSFHWQQTDLAPGRTSLHHTVYTGSHWPDQTLGCMCPLGKAGGPLQSGRDSSSPGDKVLPGLCWHSNNPQGSRSKKRHQYGWCRCHLDRTNVVEILRGSKSLLGRCFL